MGQSELIAACRLSDHPAFADLVGRYRPPRLAWVPIDHRHHPRCGRRPAGRPSPRLGRICTRSTGGARFDTWLHRIAANAAFAVVRRRTPVERLDVVTGEPGIALTALSRRRSHRHLDGRAARRESATRRMFG
ncbi:hypothetical protein [Rhodococcus sp. RS1C4]|nr:hypothetical protein [Rhodococcus sp. RS1C4]